MRVNFNKESFRKSAKFTLKREIKQSAKCKHYPMLKTTMKIIEHYKAKKILIFMPLVYEPNLMIIRRNLVKNREIFIPFMRDISFKMVKLRNPFFVSKFGVRESANQNEYKKKIDLAVIPVIGVDGNGGRIGHGKGYYDIFFSELKFKPKIIFVEIKDMLIDEIITEPHDIQGDLYITPKKNYILRGNNDNSYFMSRSGYYRCCGGVFHRQKNK